MTGAGRQARSFMAGFAPRASDYAGLRRSWMHDLLAGLTVGVVALPLALAFALATGVGARAGLATAVVAGVVAAVFGGSSLQVSGPTGAMTVILVPLVAKYGAGVVMPLAVMAGLVIVASGLLRVGRLLAFVPWSLVEGFTVGIAVVIAAQEVPTALAVPKPHLDNAAAAAVVAIGRFVLHPHLAVAGLLVLTVLLAAGLPLLHRALPAGLIAVVVVTVVAEVAGIAAIRIGRLPSGLPLPQLPDLGHAGSFVAPALVVAFLGALESLLSGRVANGMTDARPFDPDRELFGQGLANVAAGFFGGMPATGAIARTAVNARAGARTRAAAIVHSLVLAIVVFAGADLVGQIPVVALAGVLLVTAFRMVERSNVRAVVTATRSDAVVFGVTAVATVALNLVTAVELGIGCAVLLAVVHLSRSAQVTSEPLNTDGVDSGLEHELLSNRVLTYRLDGPLFFAASERFLSVLTATADVDVVILRLGSMGMLDATGARGLGDMVSRLSSRGITVLLKGVTPEHARVLAAVGALAPLVERGHVFATLPEAVTHAASHVHRSLATTS